MQGSEWDDIERRLVSAWPWPALDDERRQAYRAALADLDPPAVLRAIDELSPVHRDAMPLPQTLRAHVRSGAPAFRDPPPPPPPAGLDGLRGSGSPAGAEMGPPGLAVAALVLGVCSWFVVPFIGAVLAIVFGAVAVSQLRPQPGRPGRVMALWGLWLGITSFVAWTVLVIVAGINGGDDDEAARTLVGAAYRASGLG